MCDLLGSLNGELEVFRRRRLPCVDRFGRGHPIKGVVDLDAVQAARVVLKELLVGQPLGIKNWPPFFVAETRRAEPNPLHSGIMGQLRR